MSRDSVAVTSTYHCIMSSFFLHKFLKTIDNRKNALHD